MASDAPFRPAEDPSGEGANARGLPRGQLAFRPVTGLRCGLAAGLITWVGLQGWYPVFGIPQELANVPGNAPLEKLQELQDATEQADCRNQMLFVALLGAAAGGLLGAAEGTARRSAGVAVVAGLACVVLGGAFGCLAGYLGHLTHAHFKPVEGLSELAKTIRTQSVMLGTVGVALGLLLGPLGRGLRTVLLCPLGGALAGVLAAMLYPFSMAVLWPTARTAGVLPDAPASRLVWAVLFGGLVGLTIPAVSRRRPRRKPAEPGQGTEVAGDHGDAEPRPLPDPDAAESP